MTNTKYNSFKILKLAIKNHQFLFIICCLFSSITAYSQKPLNPPIPMGPKTRVELLGADSLVGLNDQFTLRQFFGHVAFKHKDAVLTCNMAIQNETNNLIEAYGKVKINQSDTLTITGDTLYYDGNLRFAKVYGKRVVLKDKKVTLVTTRIEYDMVQKKIYYPVRGTITQDSSILKSDIGYYNTREKIFNYRKNVEIIHPKYTLKTDSLDYDSNTKLATFISPTKITSKDGGIVNAYSGTYRIDSQESNFKGRSKVENENYFLEGDTLFFNNKTESGIAKGNVKFYSKKDKITLTGKVGIRKGNIGFTKVFGNAIMQNFEEKDTLYLRGDTLTAYEIIDSTQKIKPKNPEKEEKKFEKLIAEGNVKVFRNDMQSRCDSLIYNLKDSTIHFFEKPIIWSNKSQLEADTIHVIMVNNKIRTMDLLSKSFVIAQDTIMNFNQIKGRKIKALFTKESDLDKIYVDGNGESIYYALDDKNKMIGLNHVECSKMALQFKEKKVNRISFVGSPESRLVTPKEISVEETKLEHFEWKEKNKPTKKEILGEK